jgi:dipeptidyl aminopeptidase/acylaminoacyl peptidase
MTHRRIVPLLLVSAAALACAGDPAQPMSNGAIEVTTVTDGEPPDPDGYTVTLDGEAATELGANSEKILSDVPAGGHQLELASVAPHCTVSGSNPRQVTVAGGSMARVRFELVCATPSGSIELTATTSGGSPDPDGYIVSLDGGSGQPLASGGMLRFAGVIAGDHQVGLSGIAPNCAVSGPNPVTATVTTGETRLRIQVTCQAAVGSAEVTVTTTGAGFDPDGYRVTVDAMLPQPIGLQGSVRFGELVPGNHQLLLSGLALNCAVQGDNPRSLTIAALEIVSIAFQVDCRASTTDRGILFESGRDTAFPRYHLYRARADGAEVVDLTPASDGEDGRWSPDGSRIAFTSYRDGNADIYLMNPDGSGVVRLTHDPAYDNEPAWSPDGRRIAFVSTRTGGSNLYVMNADGTGVTSLTGVSGGFEPSWSPDGASIAFSRVVRLCQFDVCLADIFVVPAAGGTASNVTRNAGGQAYDPAWSPDGSRIAYSQDRQIYTIRPDGSGKTKLSRDPTAQDVGPVWSPDGLRLAFTRYLAESEMLVMNADGTGGSNISARAGSGYATDWR